MARKRRGKGGFGWCREVKDGKKGEGLGVEVVNLRVGKKREWVRVGKMWKG
jgi:hypothetical protein